MEMHLLYNTPQHPIASQVDLFTRIAQQTTPDEAVLIRRARARGESAAGERIGDPAQRDELCNQRV
jgi:hypothetical protein